MSYHHLTEAQRSQIQVLSSMKLSLRSIATKIGTSASTVSRERRRNSFFGEYDYRRAHMVSRQRWVDIRSQRRKWTKEIEEVVIACLKKGWSPEQISGRLKRETNMYISHERIYQFISENYDVLGCYLRRKGKKYAYKRGSGLNGRGKIKNRIEISKRPAVVEDKIRIGDLEVDTIIGPNHKGVLLSVVDRASKFTWLRAAYDKSAASVTHALLTALKPMGKGFVKTITCDNGKEFAMHELISSHLKAPVYFCRPYHSWERGLNEHTNGLIREYVPKKARIDNLCLMEIQKIADKLNNRPRKVLNYRTPYEVLLDTLTSLVGAT